MTWTIDLDAATATHDSGLVVKFAPAPGEPGAFDGKIARSMPGGISFTDIPRLMREAGDAYIAARNARH